MAGTVTVTEQTTQSVKQILFDWLSSAGGAADATSTYAYDGQILAVVTIPDGAPTQPDDNYDVVLQNSLGIDLLAGTGLNRDETNTEVLTSGLIPVSASKLTLGVSSAGAALGGQVIVYIR